MTKNLTIGIAWIIFGLVITFGSQFIMESLAVAFNNSQYVYLVAIGPFITGGIYILSAIDEILSRKKSKREESKTQTINKTRPEDSKEKLHWTVELPIETVIRKRKIRVKATLYICFIIAVLSIISSVYGLLFLIVIPLIYVIHNLLAIKDEKEINERMNQYRKKMNEASDCGDENGDVSSNSSGMIDEYVQKSSGKRKEIILSFVSTISLGIAVIAFSVFIAGFPEKINNTSLLSTAFGVLMIIAAIIRLRNKKDIDK